MKFERKMNLDLVIVGGGIGGVICLKYAKDAGLEAVLLERGDRVGGLWRDLPPWQDIQFRKEDWTLGDLPIDGEDQPSILRNIEAWVERFELSPLIRLDSAVTRARPQGGGWIVATDSAEYEARYLIAATGGHNRPVIPPVERVDSSIVEVHSSALRDAAVLRGKQVAVVGGAASAFDLLDLCFVQGAASVGWIYRSTKWMRPTRGSKYAGTDMRRLAKYQMLGAPVALVNWDVNRDLRARYAKAGVEQIMPRRDFDIERDQLVPGRRHMIANFKQIRRIRGEPGTLRGNTIHCSTGDRVEADLLLWATGYAIDLDWLGMPALGRAGLNEIAARCSSVFRSLDAPNLFLLAPGVLESNTSTPWAYAHAAKSMMSHIAGHPVFVRPPRKTLTNHFDLLKMLAPHDRANYPIGLWRAKYLWLALFHPHERPLPLP